MAVRRRAPGGRRNRGQTNILRANAIRAGERAIASMRETAAARAAARGTAGGRRGAGAKSTRGTGGGRR